MKTLKFELYLTVEEAASIYEFLDKLSSAIWITYGTELEQLYQQHQSQHNIIEEDETQEAWCDDEIPF